MLIRLVFLTLFALSATPAFGQSPTAVEQQVLQHLVKLSEFAGHHSNQVRGKVDAENSAIKSLLRRSGKRRDILKFALPKLAKEMNIATSPDGKLRAYSWNAESGGSADWYETVFQYLSGDGKVRTWAPQYGEGEVCPPFYSQIFQADLPDGRVYLLNSTSLCSTSLSTQDVSIARIDSTKLVPDVKLILTRRGITDSIRFEYDFFSVVDHPERPIKLVFYDATKKSLRFPVVIEDEKMPQGRVTDKFITYKFNGKYFVKVS
jgi:hypothetical protein